MWLQNKIVCLFIEILDEIDSEKACEEPLEEPRIFVRIHSFMTYLFICGPDYLDLSKNA